MGRQFRRKQGTSLTLPGGTRALEDGEPGDLTDHHWYCLALGTTPRRCDGDTVVSSLLQKPIANPVELHVAKKSKESLSKILPLPHFPGICTVVRTQTSR